MTQRTGSHNPPAPFTAEDCHEAQERFKGEILNQVGSAVAYRRYFKQLRPGDKVVLEHGLGRFPLVEVYELVPITTVDAQGGEHTTTFYLYYHRRERDRDRLYTEDRGMVRWPWGVPLEQCLAEYHVEWEEDDSLEDVINDFLEAFFTPPIADHMAYRTSQWVDEHRGATVRELMVRDEWPDICWAFHPQKLLMGSPLSMTVGEGVVTITPLVGWAHLTYDTLAVMAADDLGIDEAGNAVQAIDLMILLRA